MGLIKFHPGFLERVERAHGFLSDAAFAGAIGVSNSVLSKAKKSEIATPQMLVGISQAFGYGLGEIAYVDTKASPAATPEQASEPEI